MLSQLSNSLVPASLSGPVLLDRHGLPRYWATVWSTASTGQLAASTHLKKLRYIDNLYAHAESLCGPGALDDALGSLDDATLAEILESWFVSIRNQPKTFGGVETRRQTGFGFVSSVVTWISKSGANSAGERRVLRRRTTKCLRQAAQQLERALNIEFLEPVDDRCGCSSNASGQRPALQRTGQLLQKRDGGIIAVFQQWCNA